MTPCGVVVQALAAQVVQAPVAHVVQARAVVLAVLELAGWLQELEEPQKCFLVVLKQVVPQKDLGGPQLVRQKDLLALSVVVFRKDFVAPELAALVVVLVLQNLA